MWITKARVAGVLCALSCLSMLTSCGAYDEQAAPPSSSIEPSPAPSSAPQNEVPPSPPAEDAGEAKDAEEARDARNVRDGEGDAGWGQTLFLSNDDSMSLASAQRVLHALSRGLPLEPSQVRPHELLNYFTFDTVSPAGDQIFGVMGTAEREGDRLSLALAVRGASPPRPPLDLTVVVDRSGSMREEDRMGYTRRALQRLAKSLHPGDRVDLVLFDTRVNTVLEGHVVGQDPPSKLEQAIAGIKPRGGTDLAAGLTEAYRLQTSRTEAETHGRARRVLVITDALLNHGNVDQHLVSDVGTAFDQHDIRLSGVGVGSDFNDEMLDLLTEKGRGAYVYLGSEAVVDRIFGSSFDSLVQTVASDVRFQLDLPDSLAMEKFYGEELSIRPQDVQPIHYQAGTTQLFLQDLQIRDGKLVPSDPITLRIDYRDAVTDEPEVQELRTTVGALLDSDPHNVRKGRALMAFSELALARAMGTDPCGEALDIYRSRVTLVMDDPEIGFVSGLVGQMCPNVPAVELKVRVDADVPVDTVELACGSASHREALTSSDTVARFRLAQPGSCTLRLGDQPPVAVRVPSSGMDVRCVVRAGRASCG
jgi:Ca-activated chloride channel family protein